VLTSLAASIISEEHKILPGLIRQWVRDWRLQVAPESRGSEMRMALSLNCADGKWVSRCLSILAV